MFEMSQKELVGQCELPGQEKEDRKEHEEGANVSDKANGYVENEEVEKLRILTSPSQKTRCVLEQEAPRKEKR